jgi:hypothetical protein
MNNKTKKINFVVFDPMNKEHTSSFEKMIKKLVARLTPNSKRK